MREIEVDPGWRDTLDGIVGKRRDAFVLVGIVVMIAAGVIVLSSRRSPASIAPPAADVVFSPSAAPVQVVLVHVSGRVRRPGLYELVAGARVADAIELAGGARRPEDLNLLNLAGILQDGQKVHVGASSGAIAASPSTPGLQIVNLNLADGVALETIPGIGPAKAAAILEDRERNGGFDAVEDLLRVQGIGPATLEAIRPYVTV